MARRQQVFAELRIIGGKWDSRNRTFKSPAGTLWNASGSHIISALYSRFESKARVYDRFIEQIREGVSPCDAPMFCDFCNAPTL